MCSYTCFGDYSCVSNSNFNNTEHFYGPIVYANSVPQVCGNSNTQHYVMKDNNCYFVGPLTNNTVNSYFYLLSDHT